MTAPPNGQQPGRSPVYNHLVMVTQPGRIIRSAWNTKLLPIAYCILPIYNCLLPRAYCLLCYCLLPIANSDRIRGHTWFCMV